MHRQYYLAPVCALLCAALCIPADAQTVAAPTPAPLRTPIAIKGPGAQGPVIIPVAPRPMAAPQGVTLRGVQLIRMPAFGRNARRKAANLVKRRVNMMANRGEQTGNFGTPAQMRAKHHKVRVGRHSRALRLRQLHARRMVVKKRRVNNWRKRT